MGLVNKNNTMYRREYTNISNVINSISLIEVIEYNI